MSIVHWAVVVLVFTLLFGRGYVSGFMADLGKAVKNARGIGKELEGPDA